MDFLFAASIADNMQPDGVSLTLNLASSNSNVLMHYRELALAIHGPWAHADAGVLSFTAGKIAVPEALDRGFLFVCGLHPQWQAERIEPLHTVFAHSSIPAPY